MNEETKVLVQRLMLGDQEAFAELVSIYKKRVYALAYRMMGNHAEADEVTQETFVRVYEKRQDLRAIAYLQSFILRIASNYAIDLLRRRQKRFVSIDDDEEMTPSVEAEMAEGNNEPDRYLENKELAELIRSAVEKLPPRQKITVILHDIEGYSMTEAAATLGCPEATVRSNLHIARAKLKKWLARKI
jgi:RNA polymerase sigma-70 factor (ECF subfamily)